MGIYAGSGSFTSQPPMSLNDGRDETFLIDAPGIWVPECEIIFYGLMGTEYQESLYKLRELTNFDSKRIYRDIGFFQASDLIRYLSSPDDTMDMEMSDDEVERAMNVALSHYMYIPCSETMMRHSIMEIMYDNFVKSVTLVYPWAVRPLDVEYLRSITPEAIMDKLILTTGKIPDVIEATDLTYTTIITNSIEDINLMVDDPKRYRVDSTMFLLRNHSGNMIMYKNPEDGSVEFIEDNMDDLLPKLIDMKTGFPRSRIRFGRFEPQLYSDMEQRVTGFKSF